MLWRSVLMSGALLSLAACGDTAEEAPAPEPVQQTDPRIASLASAADLATAEEICKDVMPYATDAKDKTVWGPCATKMSELIKIDSFEAGLRTFKGELKDGKVTSLKAMAYQRVLEGWLRTEASKQTSATLFAWRKQVPTSEEDTSFLYNTMRDHINDALKKKS